MTAYFWNQLIRVTQQKEMNFQRVTHHWNCRFEMLHFDAELESMHNESTYGRMNWAAASQVYLCKYNTKTKPLITKSL